MRDRQKGKHLTYADRKYIEKVYKLKAKEEIADYLGIHPYTLTRELMRCEGEYNAKEAQDDADLKIEKRNMIIREKHNTNTRQNTGKKRVKICLEMNPEITPEKIAEVTGMNIQMVERYLKSAK